MKNKSLALLLGSLGLVALVSIVNIESAQTEPSEPSTELLEQQAACQRITVEEGEPTADGGYLVDYFTGLSLTDEQRSAYDDLNAQAEARSMAIHSNAVSMADPTKPLIFGENPNSSAPPDVREAIQAVIETDPHIDRQEELNQEFGQYGKFLSSYITYYTPEQEAQFDQITEDFYEQVAELMTSEQLPLYRENLAGVLRVNEACKVDGPISSLTPTGNIVDEIPELQ